MARESKEWHPDFLEYMKSIVNHKNYNGLPIEKNLDGSYKWVVTAQTEIGKARIRWCKNKARELGFPIQAGVYADVMLAIHPTKVKVCQTCGSKMSLYYVYPNANLVKAMSKSFKKDFSTNQNIFDIWDILSNAGFTHDSIASFFISKGNLTEVSVSSSKETILNALELVCRKGNKNCLGPGAMSNFPDRFDGFHSYNRCCRTAQDKGRSKENLKTYGKDRRAYEYWSDGNIHAADLFMKSSFFNGKSADHVGPISLGFVHDPRYLQPMSIGDNSAKRDRLQLIDIEKILQIAQRTGVCPMSWYSCDIWNYIVSNYKKHPDLIGTKYRNALKQNMSNFMYILWFILDKCQQGKNFLITAFLEPNTKCFDSSYKFDSNGNITKILPRHHTDRNQGERDRYFRIAIQSVYDYKDKRNRNVKNNLVSAEQKNLEKICTEINNNGPCFFYRNHVESLVKIIEQRIIAEIS